MRRLLVDIETSPNLVYAFDLIRPFITVDQVVTPSRMICWSAKWYGEPAVYFKSEFHDGRHATLTTLHKLLDDADVLIHYNGKKFDEPRVNNEFYRDGMAPPSPSQRIDLWRTISKRFDFPSSKLTWALREAELPDKVETGGFQLWRRCLDGDADAWDTMREYNMNDVEVMEPLYDKLRPWIEDHPNFATYNELPDCCPNCGSLDLQRRGFARTGQSTYQRFRCNHCGTWSRRVRRVSGATLRTVAA